MRAVGVLLGLSWLAGCGGGDSSTPSPPAFSYNGSRPFPAVVGEAIALTPAVSGSIDRYAVSPELPPGLSLNGSTGVISGKPTQSSASAIFAITATYQGGHSTFSLVLSVTEPPSHLSYSSPVKGTVGAALTPLSPRIAGTVEHYAVTPALPLESCSIARAASSRVRPASQERWPLIRSRRAVWPVVPVSYSCWLWLRRRHAAANDRRARSLPIGRPAPRHAGRHIS